jgi:uncharacterized repeat protein (TIGR01451 family)
MIAWGAARPPVPIASGPPLSPTPRPVLPAQPPASESRPIAPFTPPRDEALTGPPRLDVQMTNVGPTSVAVGEYARFNLTVTNRGETAARNILVLDRFAPGLRHEEDRRNELAVKYEGMSDLAVGESASVALSFQVVAAGEQCHTATVSADGAEAVTRQACVRGVSATLGVTINGPRRRVVGETAEFEVVIRNDSDVPATNVEVIHQLDSAYRAQLTDPGMQQQADGSIRFRVGQINARQTRTYRMTAQCAASKASACHLVTVTADGGVVQAAQSCPEIVDRMP